MTTWEPSRAIKLCGTEQADAPSRTLRAGPLTVDLEGGQLRYAAYDGVEVLRGVAFLVRDVNWGTYTPEIHDLRIDERDGGFVVTYRANCGDNNQRLTYETQITGAPDGSLIFKAVATPETDVITNRTGFVVLHPAGLTGRAVKVGQVDGREVETHFPECISPSQPIFSIRSLTHEAAPGLWATCRMEGDAFEMEDQRNWSDASYKTYVRPLALPWGYTLAEGSRHEQSVKLTFSGATAAGAKTQGGGAMVTLGQALARTMPCVGLAVSAEEATNTVASLDALQRMKPRSIVCNVDVRNGRGIDQLAAYRQIADCVGADVTLEIVVADNADAAAALTQIAAAVERAGLKPESIIVSSESDLKSWQPGAKRPERPTVEEIAAAARAVFTGVKLGGGMLSTFTELNRKRPKAELFDYVGHTTCPIVHAADDRSVMETLETLPAIIASTKAMIGGKPHRIGPSSIGARDNPYGPSPVDNPRDGRVCLTGDDPRQGGLFNAAWTLGYFAACAYAGVEAVALGAATGPFGFIHVKAARPRPYFDALEDIAIYPAFHVMAGLAGAAGKLLIEVSAPAGFAALAWHDPQGPTLWLANLAAQPRTVRLEAGGFLRRISVMDAANFDRATTSFDALDAAARPFADGDLTLDAYAVARFD